MYLKQKPEHKVHISHLHHFVSAYETNEENVKWLEDMIKEALKVAREKTESQIVDQDCLEHIFVCYPFGTVSLYRRIADYEVIND